MAPATPTCLPDQDSLQVYPKWKAPSYITQELKQSGALTSAFLDEWEDAYRQAFGWAWGEAFTLIKRDNLPAAKFISRGVAEDNRYDVYLEHLEATSKKDKSRVDLFTLTPKHIILSAFRAGAAAALAGEIVPKKKKSEPFQISLHTGRKDFYDGARNRINITGFGTLVLRQGIPREVEVADLIAVRVYKQWRMFVIHKKIEAKTQAQEKSLQTKIIGCQDFVDSLPMAEELFDYLFVVTQQMFFDLKKVGFKVASVQRQVAHLPGFVRDRLKEDTYYDALSKALPVSMSADAIQQGIATAKQGGAETPTKENRFMCMAKARPHVYRPTYYVPLPKFGNITMDDPILPNMDIQSVYVFQKDGGWWFHINYVDLPED